MGNLFSSVFATRDSSDGTHELVIEGPHDISCCTTSNSIVHELHEFRRSLSTSGTSGTSVDTKK